MAHRLIIFVWVMVGLPACQMMQSPSASLHDPVLGNPIVDPPMQTLTYGDRQLPIPPAPGERVPLHPGPPIVEPEIIPEPKEEVPPTPIVKVKPDPPLVAALRAFLDERPEDAVGHLRGMKSSNEELMLQLIPTIVHASRIDMETSSAGQMGMLAEELERAMRAVAARSPMVIKKAVFCRWVEGYGRYGPFPDDQLFQAGSPVELYAEIGNIPSVPISKENGSTKYVTHLEWTLQLRDATGNVVETQDQNRRPVLKLRQSRREETQSQIRDYFMKFVFIVPSEPGSYTVTFEVTDQAHRSVSKTMGFRVR